MMFNVRCLQCKNSIGKGVRFNAHKKHVDTYLSTKIYDFTMNCHLCSNKFVIRTDPQKCDYTIVSGLEKRVSERIFVYFFISLKHFLRKKQEHAKMDHSLNKRRERKLIQMHSTSLRMHKRIRSREVKKFQG